METKSTNSISSTLLGPVWPETNTTNNVSLMNSKFIKSYSALSSSLSRVKEIASQSIYSPKEGSLTHIIKRFEALKNLDDHMIGDVLDFMISGSPDQVKVVNKITSSSSSSEIVGYIISCLREVQSCFSQYVKTEDAADLQQLMSANDSIKGVYSGWGPSPSLNKVFRYLYMLSKFSILEFTPRIYDGLRKTVQLCKESYNSESLDLLLWLLSWADSEHENEDYMACFVVSYTIVTLYNLPEIKLSWVDSMVFDDNLIFDPDQLRFVQSLLIFISNVNEYLTDIIDLDANQFLNKQVRMWSLLSVARLLRGSRERILNLFSKASNPQVDPVLFSTFSSKLLV